jgi:HSP20 family protein
MANIAKFDPFHEMVDDLFRGFFVRPMRFGAPWEAELPRMKVDVAESDAAFLVAAELPGARKEDIQVAIDGAQVTISAEVKHEQEAVGDRRVLHAERAYGRTSRSFTLPQEIDEARAEARFRDGVLELKLPKKAAAARRQIEIH